MNDMRLRLRDLPAEAEELRDEVRDFLDVELEGYPAAKRAFTWSHGDPAFSRKMADHGWIGMTWPERYGGANRSALERYVVLEEMLAAGAPVGAHWVADRQSGPLLLRYGSEDQRQSFLPRMCRAEIFFCIGMSEPDSGSDLASIRSRARKSDDGWIVNGTKLWVSGAHTSDYMVALLRTDDASSDDRHGGLSQFIIDMKGSGVSVRPIRDLTGGEHFCEVVFEDALVAEDMLVGERGSGWAQVTAELALERSGPERYLSCFPLLAEMIAEMMPDPSTQAAALLGKQIAQLATLRTMSIAVAGMLDDGDKPVLEAALVKDLGAQFEQGLPEVAQNLVDAEPWTGEGANDFQQILAHLVQNAPSFSLRGGTREILRGIIARGLGLR